MVHVSFVQRFISCPVTKSIWIGISQLWGSLTGNVLSPFQWVFIEGDRVLPSPEYKFVFDYLRYLGMWYIWNLRNGFLFDGLSGVSQQICRIRGKLIWQFSQLCCMGTLSPNELHLCRFVLQHLRRLSLPHRYL